MTKNKTKGYKIDFTKNTITVNYKFAAAMNKYGSEEYNIYRNIISDFPQIKLIVKAGREYKTARHNKRVTYTNMKKYMSTFNNSEELLAQFEVVQKKSKILASPYKYVCDWFKAQFPKYKDIPTFETNETNIPIAEMPNIDEYKKKNEDKAA
jgi:hypothetical protein